MTTYNDFIKQSKYIEDLKYQEKAFRDVERVIRRVRKLADEDPDAYSFEELRKETKMAIERLDQKETVRQDLVIENCSDYTEDEDYMQSLDDYDTSVMKWTKLLSVESGRVYGATTAVKN